VGTGDVGGLERDVGEGELSCLEVGLEVEGSEGKGSMKLEQAVMLDVDQEERREESLRFC
jgi:hypothetical protein